MPTRWKTESPDELIFMHEHNRMSLWYYYLLSAARELSLPVCCRTFPNHWDGSTDKVFLVPKGTKRVITALAEFLREADYARD